MHEDHIMQDLLPAIHSEVEELAGNISGKIAVMAIEDPWSA